MVLPPELLQPPRTDPIPTSAVILIQARLPLPQLPAATALPDLPQTLPQEAALPPDLTALTAAATQDLLQAVLPEAQATETVAAPTPDLTTAAPLQAHPILPATIPDLQTLPTTPVAEVAATPTPDPPTAALLQALPAVTQDHLQAAHPVAQAAEATQAPAAQNQAEAAIQEAVILEAVHQEVHTQAAAQEEAHQEDKFKVQNSISKSISSRGAFFLNWHISTLTH